MCVPKFPIIFILPWVKIALLKLFEILDLDLGHFLVYFFYDFKLVIVDAHNLIVFLLCFFRFAHHSLVNELRSLDLMSLDIVIVAELNIPHE